jgi:F0F1-type ATP synthase assembly protein I
MDEGGGSDQGMRILSYLVAGLLVYGGVGWVLDYLFATTFIFPLGIIVGAAAGIYMVIMRYGRLS